MVAGKRLMMSLNAKLVAVLISVAIFPPVGAPAMTLEDFGRMNNDDEATYVALLVEASAQMLKAQGQNDQAAKTLAFFKEPGKFGGAQQLASHVQAMFATNKLRATNPNNRVSDYQIEDAMEATLREQGIVVPAKYLLARGKDFHPIGPPRQHLGE
jgi:hypothetical protein